MRDADKELSRLARAGVTLDAATEAAYRAVLAAENEKDPTPPPRVEPLARRKKAKQ
jgi:hypothetical protein